MSVTRSSDLLKVLALAAVQAVFQANAAQVLQERPVHLRSGSIAEWDSFTNSTPAGATLTLSFLAEPNTREASLFIAQDDVKLDWAVQINGKKLGALFLMEAPLVHALSIPAGTLREGTNVLSIIAPKENDDILIGPISLERRGAREILTQSTLEVDVTETETAAHLPSRLTLVDQDGRLAPLVSLEPHKTAARPGVVYTADGRARLGLKPGKYTVYVTRGFEYSLGHKEVVLGPGQSVAAAFQLRREVDTRGLVCSDTHIHTGTYARHGDATVEERVMTLAGEGIELPISTEHDCLVDLSGAARRAGVSDWFTPVIGDEVTTTMGHFNIFPVAMSAALPDRKITNWPALMEQFRRTPGVQVVVLNHPRNIHNGFQPFAATNFNAQTGENLRGFEFSFDAIEVANSSALQSDWMASFKDWFALLNYGYRVTAVGSSDGHDVSRYIVGQGRTYIACNDSALSRINVDEACQNLRRGRAWVSMGLLADMTVEDRFRVGDLATNLSEMLRVRVTVQGPSWVHADRVELYANGRRIQERRFDLPAEHAPPVGGRPLREEVTWVIPRPKRDIHLIAFASGPPVRDLYWAIPRPYQPSSTRWEPRVVGVTNPIWVDADGDGRFTSAREYAKQLVAANPERAAALGEELTPAEPAIAAQIKALATSDSGKQP